ncbi:hypothetical protein QUA03_19685 [Microcoleus sp. S36b_A4]
MYTFLLLINGRVTINLIARIAVYTKTPCCRRFKPSLHALILALLQSVGIVESCSVIAHPPLRGVASLSILRAFSKLHYPSTDSLPAIGV